MAIQSPTTENISYGLSANDQVNPMYSILAIFINIS